MAKGRKNGCPTNIRDWQISILDREADGEDNWVCIRGLKTMTRSVDSETADGSAGTDLWEEPYVTKRSAVLKLSGKAVGCIATGETDPGQGLLDSYAKKAGCMADATLKFVDPYSHAMVADFIVASAEKEDDDTESSVSWELRQVGEAEELPYVPVQGIALEEDTLSLQVGGDKKTVKFSFVPENASNRRFRVQVSGKQVAAVSDITDSGFSVRALAEGTATIVVISLNGQKTASLTVNAEG
ncbi:MAG: Ig domain-containing protein [Clostridia bacterium]|nr:Ig domain-containing protein [Clostridia bacterium]